MDYLSIFQKLNLPYRENEPMSRHTTFKIGGPCDYLVEPYNEYEVKELISLLKENNLKYFVMGNGSNLLVSDLGIEGVVIKIGSNMSNITVENNLVKAGFFGIVNTVIDEFFVVGADFFQLFEPTVAATHTACHNNQGCFCHCLHILYL